MSIQTKRHFESRGTLAKISYTIPEAVAASGLSRSAIYLAFKAGSLGARKSGRRTLILADELARYLENLPTAANQSEAVDAPAA